MAAGRRADAWGVKVVAVIALIVAVNVALRFVDLPDANLPSFDVPDWLAWLNRIKNIAIANLIVFALIGAALGRSTPPR